jgi:hypothetical protein
MAKKKSEKSEKPQKTAAPKTAAPKTAAKGAPKAAAKPPAVRDAKTSAPPAKVAPPAGLGKQPLTKAGAERKQETVIAALGAQAPALFKDVSALVDKLENDRLATWYALGQKFVTVKEQLKDEGIKTFCDELKVNHRDVRIAMRMTQQWNFQEMLKLVKEAKTHGGNITWSHIRLLLSKPLEHARDHWLALIQREAMGYEDMVARIKAAAGTAYGLKERESAGGGRQFDVPTTLDGSTKVYVRQTDRMTRFLDQAGAKLPKTLEAIAPERYSPDMLRQVRMIRQGLDSVAKKAQDDAEVLVEFERKVEQAVSSAGESVVSVEAAADVAAPPADAVADHQDGVRSTNRRRPAAARPAEPAADAE